jgi:hypothetical protein
VALRYEPQRTIGNILFFAKCQDESASRSAMASAISARRWSRAIVVRLRRWCRQSSAHRTRQARAHNNCWWRGVSFQSSMPSLSKSSISSANGSALLSCLVRSTVNRLLRFTSGQALLFPAGWIAVPAGRCCSVSTARSSRAASSCSASLSINATAQSCCFFVSLACICSSLAQF